jgi:Mg2+ and Co2+ transporter CorA
MSTSSLRAVLFDSTRLDSREVDPATIDMADVDDTRLLWIDATEAQDVEAVLRRLALPDDITERVRDAGTAPDLLHTDGGFWLRAHGLREGRGAVFEPMPIDIVAARNVVVTLRCAGAEKAHGLDLLQTHGALGRLDSERFVAALLHGVLSTYFAAVGTVEARVERVEESILAPDEEDCIEELRQLVRSTSRMRRSLAAHRKVFSGLARPDFGPCDDDDAPRRHFAALDEKYERAMDVVENSRDLVIDCFELFSSRTALSTNETMRALTFITVLIGGLAVAAGVLGMNFKVAFFEAKHGFWIALGAMSTLTTAAVLLGKHRRWF